METAQDCPLTIYLCNLLEIVLRKIRMITTSTEKFHSGDFDKTPPTVTVHIPKQLIHKQVETDGVQDAYSAARKHPVFSLICLLLLSA